MVVAAAAVPSSTAAAAAASRPATILVQTGIARYMSMIVALSTEFYSTRQTGRG